MAVKREALVAKKTIQALKDFADYLQSGKPLEENYKVTKVTTDGTNFTFTCNRIPEAFDDPEEDEEEDDD